MQMKYHVLLASIYYGGLYFGYVLKYNYVVIKNKTKNCDQ